MHRRRRVARPGQQHRVARLGHGLVRRGGDLNLDSGNGTLLTVTDIASSVQPFVENTTIFALINYSGSWNSGLFTYGGNVLADGSQFQVGSQWWEIDYNRTSSAGIDNFTADYLPSSSFVTVTAVPEPATLTLALLGVAAGLAVAAFRRRERAEAASSRERPQASRRWASTTAAIVMIGFTSQQPQCFWH